MITSNKNKIILLLLVIYLIILTGCEDMPQDIRDNINNAFSDRSMANIAEVEKLYNSGIISENTYELLVKSIKNSLEIDFTNDDTVNNILKSIVAWRTVPVRILTREPIGEQEAKYDWFITEEGASTRYITNYIAAMGLEEEVLILNDYGADTIKPLEVISESEAEALNNELSVPIYVLKTDIESAEGLDGIVEAVKQASDSKSESGLFNYFEEATYIDADGNEKPVTLIDPTDEESKLIRITSGSTLVNGLQENGTLIPLGHWCDVGDGDETCMECLKKYDNRAFYHGDTLQVTHSSGEKPGKDMIITMSGEDIMAVRLLEFNSEAIEKLNKEIGLGNKRFLVLNNRAYLMEYPVGYVSGFKENEDRTEYKAIIEQSQLGFNLLTGEFSKFDSENGKILNSSVTINPEDPYLTYDGAISNTDKSKASLVLYGNTGIDDAGGTGDDEYNPCWNIALGTYTEKISDNSYTKRDRIVNMGRIVLRDYLEATYAPNIVGQDKLIVLGRKLRIENFSGSKNNVIARFYDKDGNLLGEDSAKLFIDDFADIEELIDNTPTSTYISKEQEVITTQESNNNTNNDNETDNGIVSSLSKIDSLDRQIKDRVMCTTKFPGINIGASDESYTDNKPLFYAIAIKKSMFETGLFSGWIQSSDSEKNSTEWWNGWLSSHSYIYNINTNNLTNFLKGNYAYDLNKEGVIVLDLETISRIQEHYEVGKQKETSTFIRTAFIVFGYFLIAYSLILIAAWNLDVNVDFGFSILEKLSLGRWVAIKNSEEIPRINTDNTIYVDFGDVIKSSFIIMAIGVLLITVNILDLVLAIIRLFGGFASYISKIMTGVR